ncbi:MAG TPA: hypothetical protein VM782_03135 [Stellaceae bacterium]|nr:hypothetical protein [Stellaceae bacterium]
MVSAPGPVTVPAVAAPPAAAPLVADPLLGRPLLPPDADPPFVPLALAPPLAVLAAAAFSVVVPAGFVLVNVLPATPVDVEAEGSVGGVAVEGLSSGRRTKPSPTCPVPPEPGVGPPTAGSAPFVESCAMAGKEPATRSKAIVIIFMQRQRSRTTAVPERWPRRSASATVAAS